MVTKNRDLEGGDGSYGNASRSISSPLKENVASKTFILSRVRGSVTNNNGFWIVRLDLLTLLLQLHSVTITIGNCLSFVPFLHFHCG
jgi:hypothetical protein